MQIDKTKTHTQADFSESDRIDPLAPIKRGVCVPSCASGRSGSVDCLNPRSGQNTHEVVGHILMHGWDATGLSAARVRFVNLLLQIQEEIQVQNSKHEFEGNRTRKKK